MMLLLSELDSYGLQIEHRVGLVPWFSQKLLCKAKSARSTLARLAFSEHGVGVDIDERNLSLCLVSL